MLSGILSDILFGCSLVYIRRFFVVEVRQRKEEEEEEEAGQLT
jgi:hypothetical protein